MLEKEVAEQRQLEGNKGLSDGELEVKIVSDLVKPYVSVKEGTSLSGLVKKGDSDGDKVLKKGPLHEFNQASVISKASMGKGGTLAEVMGQDSNITEKYTSLNPTVDPNAFKTDFNQYFGRFLNNLEHKHVRS